MFRWRMRIPHVKFFSLNGDFRYQTAKPISSKLKTRSINAQKNQKGFKIVNWHSATHVFIIEFWFNQVFPYSQSANKFGRSSNPSNSDLNSVTYDMLHIICIVIHKLHTGILYIHVWNYGNIPRNPSVLGYVIIFWKRPMISTGYRLLNSPHFLDIYVFSKMGQRTGSSRTKLQRTSLQTIGHPSSPSEFQFSTSDEKLLNFSNFRKPFNFDKCSISSTGNKPRTEKWF